MPDWSYRTLFRPFLFTLRPAWARDVTLRSAQLLASLSGPVKIIEFMGNSHPGASMAARVAGLNFPTHVGLGAGLDVHMLADDALAQLGFGFIEVGPVTLDPIAEKAIEVRQCAGDIVYEEPLANEGARVVLRKLRRRGDVRLGVRLAHPAGCSAGSAATECAHLARMFADIADFFTYDARAAIGRNNAPQAVKQTIRCALEAIRAAVPAHPLFVVVPPDSPDEQIAEWIHDARACGACGAVVGGGVATAGGRLVGGSTFEKSLAVVQNLRKQFPEHLAIVGSGGIREPADACAMLSAGADLVQVHSGLVYAGPNFAKRISNAAPATVSSPPVRKNAGWVWILMMGIGIAIAGIIAWFIGSTRVILPYDERFLGLTVSQLARINARLPAFMQHDRVTYAGALLSVGLAYVFLAAFGMRTGASWARRIIVNSSIVGLASFFLFVGIRYLDPVHAAGTAVFLAFFSLGASAAPVTLRYRSRDLRNDGVWLRGLWGQLCFVFLGFGFIVGGITICVVGMTSLFVPTDLVFMHTTPSILAGASPHLIPLLAHDRAYFGGALIVNGMIWMLAALWGFDRGVRWVWWMFAICGFPGFIAAIAVHFSVGYTDSGHLFPVYFALALYVAGLACSYGYLNGGGEGKEKTRRIRGGLCL
jgi:dihydroorotate dehydrogenase